MQKHGSRSKGRAIVASCLIQSHIRSWIIDDDVQARFGGGSSIITGQNRRKVSRSLWFRVDLDFSKLWH